MNPLTPAERSVLPRPIGGAGRSSRKANRTSRAGPPGWPDLRESVSEYSEHAILLSFRLVRPRRIAALRQGVNVAKEEGQ